MGDNGHVKRYRVRITPRADTRCVVLSCPANHGEQGCTCDYAYTGTPCNHPQFRHQWYDRGAYYPHLVEAKAEPAAETLTARVSKAQRGGRRLTSAQIRAKIEQLEMQFEEVRVEI